MYLLPDCCARAASGHAAAPPSSVMNSRRFMGFVLRVEDRILAYRWVRAVLCSTAKQAAQLPSWVKLGPRATSAQCLDYPRKRPCGATPVDVTEVLPIADMASHSITSSASCWNDSVIFNPKNLAVFKLITSSNLVGCITGSSAGLAPLSIRLT